MSSFSNELINRAKPDNVMYFLRVKKRGLRFNLHKTPSGYKKFFVVPGMILMVIAKSKDNLVVKWCGPALETDLKKEDVDEYSEDRTFIIDIPISYLKDKSVVKISSSDVVKMKDHVPAVLY